MSDQNTLSRRRALSLLGATALTAQAATARSQDVIAAATSTRPRYIFGYGSLIERESRMATWPSAQFASPVIVKGVARGWFDHRRPQLEPDLSRWGRRSERRNRVFTPMERSSRKIPAERRRFFGFERGSWRPWRRRGAELPTAVGEAFVAWRLPPKRTISPAVTLVTSSRQAPVLPSDKLIDGELFVSAHAEKVEGFRQNCFASAPR
jgi:hypothetical protein